MNSRALQFVRLALRRLRSRPGLTFLSLLGVVLTVGMVTSIPIFSQAVSYLVLREELDSMAAITTRSPLAVRFYYLASQTQPLPMAGVRQMEGIATQITSENVGLPVKETITFVASPQLSLRPADPAHYAAKGDTTLIKVALSVFWDTASQVDIVEGAPFGQAERRGRLGMWVSQEFCNETGVHLDEEYDLLLQGTGSVIPMYVAGIYRPKDPRHPYWYWSADNGFLITPEIYEEAIEPLVSGQTFFDSWYIVLDDRWLTIDRADTAAEGLRRIANLVSPVLPGTRMDVSPLGPLNGYLQRKATLSVILTGFALPAMGLLFYFLALISTVTVQFQREETSILASRGAGRGFILGLAGLETGLLILIGAPLGLGLGYLLSQMLGFSLGFLTFVRRSWLPASMSGLDWRLLAGALLMLLLARLLPALRAARQSVVSHLWERSRPSAVSHLVKLAVDIPLVLTAAYAYQQLSQRGTIGLISWEPSGDPFQDPLLLLAPSLFIFTASLVLAHLFPLMMRPLDALSERLRSFPAYMGVRRLARQSTQYTNALFLVIVCLSLGAFYSSMALSLDQWLRDRIRYQVGCDYSFRQGEDPELQSLGIEGAGGAGGALPAWLLPVSDYLEIPGVEEATRLGDYAATPVLPSASRRGRFLGLDRLDFPGVAYFRLDFAEVPLGELMNRLGRYPDGLLVSRQFLQTNRLVEGQRLPLEVKVGTAVREVNFTLVGSYDYFPTAYAAKEEVFVGNLDYLFEQMGDAYLHDMWLRTTPEASPAAILTKLEEMGIYVVNVQDARWLQIQDEDRVERVGLFGVLSIGFLIGSILSIVGLLVYTSASLQGRLQQLSVLRAIGVQTGEVLAMERMEYAGVIAYGVVTGAIVGMFASYLFVPFFQFTSDPALAVPPFLPQIAWGKVGLLAAIFAVALMVSQLVILYRATRRGIFQILRMGQRE